MLTLYHSPRSRSSRVIWLLEELGAEYDLQYVNIGRRTGDDVPDARNPNLLKQAPTIVHHGQVLHETVIIWIYLTDLYPQASMAPRVGDLRRAEYLAWLGLYNAVLEPVVTARFSPDGMSELQTAAYEALVVQWRGALEKGPYLMGEAFSAVDILFASLLTFARTALPDDTIYDAWLDRIQARPARHKALAKDAA